MAASRLHPQMPEIDPVGYRPIDEAQQWSDVSTENITYEDVNNYLRSLKSISVAERPVRPVLSMSDMSPGQAEVMNVLRSQISNPSSAAKRIIVQGKAGTGKSALIAAMCRLLDEKNERPVYQVLAFTGAAALNVDGKTVHNFLKLPTSGQYLPLNGETLRRFQLAMREIKYIIIDEYSMIGWLVGLFSHKVRRFDPCTADGRSRPGRPLGGLGLWGCPFHHLARS
jgi:hypothetical protein